MDIHTNETKMPPEESTNKYEIPVKSMPKKGCKRCFGRGYIGRLADGRVMVCRCTNREPKVNK